MKTGDNVIFIGATSFQVEFGGYTDPRGILSLKKDYVVEWVNVQDYITEVKLVGIDKTFNSVHFRVVETSPVDVHACKECYGFKG